MLRQVNAQNMTSGPVASPIPVANAGYSGLKFQVFAVDGGGKLPRAAHRGEGYAYAFENPNVIRSAIDKRRVRADARITGASEIAFFPPMTAGGVVGGVFGRPYWGPPIGHC
jgi:hypothetical protein